MRQFLAILVTTLLVQSASAQSLWRNFFTTNRDPIVEVVAGSNATVQATTVGSNLRRFTVNSTATGGTNSLVQTNISYVAVTNAPWQTGSANLTNWSGISTNLAAFLANNQVFTGSNYFTQPLTLSLATNTPSAGKVLTATSAGSSAWSDTLSINQINVGTLSLSNAVDVSSGGTGATNFTDGLVLVGHGTAPVAPIPAPGANAILMFNNTSQTNKYAAIGSGLSYDGTTLSGTVATSGLSTNAVTTNSFPNPSTPWKSLNYNTADGAAPSWGDNAAFGVAFARRTYGLFAKGDATLNVFGELTANAYGTATAVPTVTSGTDPVAVKWTSAASSTSSNGVYNSALTGLFANPQRIHFYIKLGETNACRYWFGLCAGGVSNFTGNDSPSTANYVTFRYADGLGDTTWKCVTKDATTASTSDSAVAVQAGVWFKLSVVYTPSVNAVFYINGSPVATNTANLPATTAASHYLSVGGGDTKTLWISRIYGEEAN